MDITTTRIHTKDMFPKLTFVNIIYSQQSLMLNLLNISY